MTTHHARSHSPSPASAAPEREWTRDQEKDAQAVQSIAWQSLRQPEEPPMHRDEIQSRLHALCSEIARVSPHFAPRPKVRLPKPYHDESFENQYGTSLEYWQHVQDVLREQGVEIEGDQP